MEIAVDVSHVSKVFKKHSEPTKTLKERLLTSRRNSTSLFNALDDVSFQVGSGETIGLLGHNGSGKSTLLKCIAGTIRPSQGRIAVRGRLAAMLELGAGFHPDLTGRENVYLNGSILGFSNEHVSSIFDDIVEFSELHDFIDSQVKHYSSGMYARLGFAVAVNLEPDVLLIDEVLSVGDEAFQRKCLERVRGFQREGRTIVLVSHSPDQVRQFCDRAVVLHRGRTLFIGEPGEAAARYRRSLDVDPDLAEEESGLDIERANAVDRASQSFDPESDPVVHIIATSVDPAPGGREFFEPGDQLTLRMKYRASAPVEAMRGRLLIKANDGVQMLNISTYDINEEDIWHVQGEGELRFVIDNFNFC